VAQIHSKVNSIQKTPKGDQLGSYPPDATPEIGARGWTWLSKYGILKAETTNFRWSDSLQWLIYLIDGQRVWQARCFGDDAKRKAYSFGDVSNILHILGNFPDKDEIIVCEDILSAIKISRFTNSMPLWGAHLPLKTITRLSRLFKRLGIWLDRDKAVESLKSNRRTSQMGLEVRSIISELDPKAYNDEEIQCFLR
jgi:hypothetical protein